MQGKLDHNWGSKHKGDEGRAGSWFQVGKQDELLFTEGTWWFDSVANTRDRATHSASYFTYNMSICQCVCFQSYDMLTDDYALKKFLPREWVAKNEEKFSVEFS